MARFKRREGGREGGREGSCGWVIMVVGSEEGGGEELYWSLDVSGFPIFVCVCDTQGDDDGVREERKREGGREGGRERRRGEGVLLECSSEV